MKFYTDLKGTIEAKPGDLIALAVSEYGGMLHQQEVSKRPRLSADGRASCSTGKRVGWAIHGLAGRMRNILLTLLAVAVLLFVWYDGVKHGYRMATEDLAVGASAGIAPPAFRLQRL